MQGTQIFYMENPQINCRDKKPWGLRPLIYDPLYEIKIYKFTWPLYHKNSLSNT